MRLNWRFSKYLRCSVFEDELMGRECFRRGDGDEGEDLMKSCPISGGSLEDFLGS